MKRMLLSSSRREFLTNATFAAAATLLRPAWLHAESSPAVAAARTPAAGSVDPRVARVLSATVGIDMHNHVYPAGIAQKPQGSFMRGPWGPQQDADPTPPPELSLKQELTRAGLTAVCAAYELDFNPLSKPGDAWDTFLRWMGALDAQLEREGLHRALNLKDLEVAHKTGTPTIVQSVEGAQFIEGRLERLEQAYDRGLRHLQMLHDKDDLVAPLGDTDNGNEHLGGLTETGKQVLKECNRLGILVDLAHGSPKTILDATSVVTEPFIVSHTSAEGHVIADPRMAQMFKTRVLSRERAHVIAQAGGVIGVWIYTVNSVPEYVQNIKAMADIAGIDHVGIGTDTNLLSWRAGQSTNRIWPDMRGGFLQAVVAEMLHQGFAPDDIRKVCGGNFCRVFGKVTAARA